MSQHRNSDSDGEQRRRFSRTRFNAPGRLDVGGHARPCEVLDLSLKGALLRLDSAHALGAETECALELQLDDESARILMRGEIAHIEDNHIGVRWREIDIDSMTHLRRLLTLNLGEPDLLDRELSALLHD